MSSKIFNLDSLRTIEVNKSYYLSSTTGEIKEAGLWHKFKCLFSSTERLKGSHLMDAIIPPSWNRTAWTAMSPWTPA